MDIYLLFVVAKIGDVACIYIFTFLIMSGVLAIIYLVSKDINCGYANDDVLYTTIERFLKQRTAKLLIASFFIAIFLSVMIPNTKQMAAIYILPKVLNSKTVDVLNDATFQAINKLIPELPEDFRKEE